MIITSSRTKGDLRVVLGGDDGKTYHFKNDETAEAWMVGNSTGLPTLTTLTPATAVAGAANTTVTLTGTGFSAASEVLVNNMPVTKVFTNATTMSTVLPTLSLPPIPARWEISVRNGVYQTAAKPFAFT
jgi:hypothetical protein